MPKTKSTTDFPEIQDIRHDLDSLKTNVIELTKHLSANGKEKTETIKASAAAKLMNLKDTGSEQLVKVEDQVKAKPVQSVAMAFAAGAALSFLLGRK